MKSRLHGTAIAAIGLLLVGCATTPPSGADLFERRAEALEALGRAAGRAVVGRVEREEGLDSNEGLRLARIGEDLNLLAVGLAASGIDDKSSLEEVGDRLYLGLRRYRSDGPLTEAAWRTAETALLEAVDDEDDEDARLRLALFVHGFSVGLLEGYEDE